jgi:CRISPR-associated endonuclease/helicase Cas3
MKKPEVLLAKSPQNQAKQNRSETLVGHTQFVFEATEVILNLLRESTPVLTDYLNSALLRDLALTAAVLHDTGKATNVFQQMLTARNAGLVRYQPVHHEILSALIATPLKTELNTWLEPLIEKDNPFFWMVSWIVGGHHLRLHRERPYSGNEADRLVRIQGVPGECFLFLSHPNVKEILQLIPGYCTSGRQVPEMKDISLTTDEEDSTALNLETIIEQYIDESEAESRKISQDEVVQLALAKAILVSADVAGSALSYVHERPRHWIEKALSLALSQDDLHKVIDARLQGGHLRAFQKQVSGSKALVTLTVAGCGNGKTLAAYEWALKHAVGKKLFFCYPTTGTASAGFEDYLLAQDSLERALIHGRAHVDMERMIGTPEDNPVEENQRLESLKVWSQQVISCTVDSVLGLIQNQRRGLFSFPALAKGAFVFDEIHNYDTKLFGALLTFLKSAPNAQVLLMSASLSKSRLAMLKAALSGRLGDPITGDSDIEGTDRYRLHWKEKAESCWVTVKSFLENGRKVLWVCNTVLNAVQIHDQALERGIEVTPFLYHSRFRYRDRVERQASVIDVFKKKGPGLVISTQVCEMSFDISANLLVTELAPIPSLVQRLGRLNRHGHPKYEKSGSHLGECLIYDFSCTENKPYKKTELEIAKDTLASLWDKPVSQQVLGDALAHLQEQEDIKTFSAWLDGRWESDQRPLREDGTSITLILEQDLAEIRDYLSKRNLRPNSQALAPWTIPMVYPPKAVLRDRIGGYPIAGEVDIEYDEIRGAKWRKKTWEIL